MVYIYREEDNPNLGHTTPIYIGPEEGVQHFLQHVALGICIWRTLEETRETLPDGTIAVMQRCECGGLRSEFVYLDPCRN